MVVHPPDIKEEYKEFKEYEPRQKKCQTLGHSRERLTRQSGLPDVASRSLSDEAKSGSPLEVVSFAPFSFEKP